jgi:hypothetical protein
VEISVVRKRLQSAIAASRDLVQRRRARTAEAERDYDRFLREVATPVAKLLVTALKAEGYPFTVFTPAGGLRLAFDRTRDDYVELGLETTAEHPYVMGRISRTRGSRTLSEERPIAPSASPEQLTEEDVLAFLLDALSPWLER